MKKAKDARKILSKIIIQGNNSEVGKLFEEIWVVTCKVFNEDNDPTLMDFLVRHMVDAIKRKTNINKEIGKSVLNHVADELR